ncbi:MAG: anaerobic ribonucleoside-triphosphate reductase activating protein [Lachnospiraceae bacterium]|nr:anaerobic ribonucleoside-triphosphate reductase activating protein [Lachnospiraceae bacterium]
MLIKGLNKTTLLDYPGRVAATIFTGGCNFRCPFCHNGDLVLKPSIQDAYSEEEVLSFLQKRKNVLKGVCITGGEPTLQADLPVFMEKVKKIGYDIKLDTNGYQPQVLAELIGDGLVDYVAMDIKNSKEKYPETAGLNDLQIEKIEESVELLAGAIIPYEFRTTVVKELHTMEDILSIGKWIAGCPNFFLQSYAENEKEIRRMQEDIITPFHAYEKDEMEEIIKRLEEIPGMKGKVLLRGM